MKRLKNRQQLPKLIKFLTGWNIYMYVYTIKNTNSKIADNDSTKLLLSLRAGPSKNDYKY